MKKKEKWGRVKQAKAPVLKPTLRLFVSNFFEHGVGKSAAALAYYLLFTLFPVLIFISNLLGLLDLNVTAITRTLQQLLPRDIVELIESYLDHVSHASSPTFLWFSLVFSVWFPMRAVKGLMDGVRLAYQLGKPKKPIIYTFRQAAYTVMFLVVIFLTFFLSTMGQRVVSFLIGLVPYYMPKISGYLLTIWQYLRFLLIALLMFGALGVLYAAALDHKESIRAILPGIAAALVTWLIASMGFSFYVENFANYSIIYGTLGAVIVLLLWLYMTAMVFILGAELNAALKTVRRKNAETSEAAV